MKTICITSTVSNAGKTTLAEGLIRKAGGWAACKVTVYNDTEAEKGFSIEDNPEVIRQEGTDTCRLKNAGAAKVLWVRTEKSCIEEAVNTAVKRLGNCERALFEGNSVLKVMKPDLAVMIRTAGEAKESATLIMDKIDMFIDGLPDEGSIRKVMERFLCSVS